MLLRNAVCVTAEHTTQLRGDQHGLTAQDSALPIAFVRRTGCQTSAASMCVFVRCSEVRAFETASRTFVEHVLALRHLQLASCLSPG